MFDWLRRRKESELDEEIRFHLERETQERMDAGLSRDDAEASARRAFGNTGQVKEIARAMWGMASLERILHDVRYGTRALLRSPAFAITAVLSLGLGIGANVASFSLADTFLLKPLPVPEPGKLIAITSQAPDNVYGNVSHPVFRDLRERTTSFEGIVGHQLGRFAFAPNAETVPQMKFGLKVTDGFFDVLGVQPALGRSFSSTESNVSGAGAVVILGHDFWRQQFAGDQRVTGSTIRINGGSFTVVGVAPEKFTGMDPLIRPAFFLPLRAALDALPGRAAVLEDRSQRELAVRARLKAAASIEQAQAELSVLARALAGEYPKFEQGRELRVRTEMDLRLRQSTAGVAVIGMLMVLSLAVLAIACANVAGLLLARSRARSREMAIRLAIGAGRARLIQQLLTETILLALAGGAAGLFMAWGAVQFISSIQVPTDTPIVIAPHLDARALLFAFAISVMSALLFGLAPALRTIAPDLLPALKSGENRDEDRRRTLGRGALVAGQVALSLVLLVTSAGLLDGFRKMLVLDPGIRTEGLLMMEFEPGMIGYNSEQTTVFFRQMVERVRGIPGVRSATLTRSIPFRPNFTEQPIVPEGYEFPRDQTSAIVSMNPVDEAYFQTTGTRIVEGRAFTAADQATSRRVGIVNEEFAKRYWPGQNAIGKRFRIRAEGLPIEVVGVAKTAKYLSLTESPAPYIYLPLAQHPQARVVLMVRSEGAPAAMTGPVSEAIRSIDPNQPVFNLRVFSDYYEQGVLGLALIALEMVGTIGLSGLSLALVGLYGLLAYSVSRRSREIGIRMAIGASRPEVLRMVLRQGLVLTVCGVAVGLALSVPVYRLLGSALAGVGGVSAWTLAAVPALLIAVSMGACGLPAWRAARIDPVRALREDG